MREMLTGQETVGNRKTFLIANPAIVIFKLRRAVPIDY
jgi:hypothetical protein